MSEMTVVYLVAVASLGLMAVLRVYLGLARNRLARIRRIARKNRFEAIPTDTPVDDPSAVARDRALQSIDRQFSVTRLIFVPLVLVATGFAATLPFLDRVPAALVSMAIAAMTILGGVAARPFLENAIAGLVISSSRLINLGDTVRIGDIYGTVEDITATHTAIKVWDWRRHLVPNSRMLLTSLLNYSLFDRHIWASVEFWVAYDADIDEVRAAVIDIARSSAYFSGEEVPEFWVAELGQQGVRCTVAAWANLPSNAWMLQHEIRMGIARFLRQRGLRPAVHNVALPSTASPAVDRLSCDPAEDRRRSARSSM